MSKELKITLRFVVLIATPLCLVNSLIFSWGSSDFGAEWLNRFLFNFVISFPQAIIYVSAIKWFDKTRKQPGLDRLND